MKCLKVDNMNKILKMISIILLIIVVSTDVCYAIELGTYNLDGNQYIKYRNKPDLIYSNYSLIPMGVDLKVLNVYDDWIYVSFLDNKEGYIFYDAFQYLSEVDDGFKYLRTTNVGSVNIREEYNTDSKILLQLYKNMEVYLLNQMQYIDNDGNTWVKVYYNSKLGEVYGYMMLKYLSIVDNN